HFLWRFWPALPGWGGMAVLDRSWYGRVLVERVEGFATQEQWQRAYREIVEFEPTLADEGMIMVKFWLHLSSAEQLKRFQAREQDPLKTWKLTAEDWRNRGKRRQYKAAVDELLDWIADYRARIPELPVQAQVGPGEVAGQLPKNAPEEAEPFARLLADLDAIVVPGVTQVQHPRYFGWFPSNATLSSALGDLATAGLGALGITWQSAPVLTEVEEVVVEWLRELTALPASWPGVNQDTAPIARLVAV